MTRTRAAAPVGADPGPLGVARYGGARGAFHAPGRNVIEGREQKERKSVTRGPEYILSEPTERDEKDWTLPRPFALPLPCRTSGRHAKGKPTHVFSRCMPSQFNTYFVTGTPDPEPWWDSDIWSACALTSVVEH